MSPWGHFHQGGSTMGSKEIDYLWNDFGRRPPFESRALSIYVRIDTVITLRRHLPGACLYGSWVAVVI